MGSSFKCFSFDSHRNFKLLLIIICILLLDFTEFPMIIKRAIDSDDVGLQTISIVSPKSADNETSQMNESHAHVESSDDWFDETKWPKSYCPYYENVCIYNQRFYVSKKEDEFHLNEHLNGGNIFGNHMPNIHESVPIYSKIFNSTTWNEAENEYERAQCIYDDVTNHMIIQGYYQTMLGEWYSRVLAELFRLYKNNETITMDQKTKMYLFIGDMAPLFTSHHLFMQPFSNYNVMHFTDLIERIECHCLKRLIFCGFRQDLNDRVLTPMERMRKRNEAKGRIVKFYPELISFYNSYMDTKDIHIERDTKLWKLHSLQKHFIRTDDTNVDEWFFIGFYQRTSRRTWLHLEMQILSACNKKYNGRKILCDSINLEGHLHPRDVVIMHRSFDMLIGIHGAHLTDAIWMSQTDEKNKYIIELLPTNGPSWTASLNTPTALGVIFWGSKFNHVGLKLVNTSITEQDWKRGTGRWYKSDFKVKWIRLSDVIDYLIIDDGGYCKKYKKAKNIKIPASFESFAIYNAFCVDNDQNQSDVWHFAKPWAKRKALPCETCSDPAYE